jgi:anti-sigma factor RsiW
MSELNDMTCAELADVAAELALGVLTGRERAVAVAHLDRCDECREHVRQLMATGEQLVELLPPAEPPAGFETRVLARLGLPAPAQKEPREETYPQLISRRDGAARRGTSRSGTRPGADQPGAPPSGPSGARRPGRMRRVVASVAVGFAVIAAGLGGWSIGAGTAPAATSAAGPLTSASLLSSTHREVGDIFLYNGTSRWVYMSVDMGTGNEAVTCQLIGKDGRVTTLGTFRLADGYGSWGSPDPGNAGALQGAQLVDDHGAVLATAQFSDASSE